MDYYQQYTEFVAKNGQFCLFDGSLGVKPINSGTKVLVLDSSYNPPHLAHFTLVKNAIEFYGHRGFSNFHVLLLLATNNADKRPKPATFDKRMAMMKRFADFISIQNWNGMQVGVSCALTTHGKFVDKLVDISKLINFGIEMPVITFLVGFDTLIRIFNPVYYEPVSVAEALRSFMESVEFCCLRREDGKYTLDFQEDYINKIINGEEEPQIPSNWGEKIHILSFNESVKNISSSMVRDVVNNKGSDAIDLKDSIPMVIVEYIKQNPSLFKNDIEE
ncbi:uncharacterized protein GVI51_B00473 [Nakaseomyces glabratus]|uniref:Cytidyltransferase-like domain-containing protein n=2 Tax=Candida glabrata TaxID=5478 RepID=Q6FX56_CANGA|nr:uncharacterized protein CAGL0B00638g [Nakaseomyces glabratus]KAH7609026.1 Cytidylyltransferase-like [Nakaseomyces glabratus]KAH7609901.1 Cytidylyltransferase-like [Nakaseomyces glabratus]KAI8400758.1 Cytidylyltransferase-like [Nakaseomyces glabratus]KAJ9570903.1 nicotinamide-nucleotide adenylyltransferase [Nakaseomyces glabratus]KTA95814.1 Nicotinamide mononucleotide adenylyltransferase [Nakaseomyces glabratus]|eukprot:XP_444998.1 uncharacterized protein CAGL0B00638g [[Candida] glabrata]